MPGMAAQAAEQVMLLEASPEAGAAEQIQAIPAEAAMEASVYTMDKIRRTT